MDNIFYWDRRPGHFVDMKTGEELMGPPFPGNTLEWYMTLLETIRSNIPETHKTILCSRDVQCIFECLIQYRPLLDVDIFFDYDDKKYRKEGTLGSVYAVFSSKEHQRNIITFLDENNENPMYIKVKALGILD